MLLRDSLVQGYCPIAVYGFSWVWTVRNVFCLAAESFLDVEHELVSWVVEVFKSMPIFTCIVSKNRVKSALGEVTPVCRV